VACRVGTVGPITGRSISSDTIECISPFHNAGKADFAIALGYGDALATNFSVEYVMPNLEGAASADDLYGNATAGEVQVVMPRHVSVHGSSRAVWFGKDFVPGGVSRCVVSSSSSAAVFVSSAVLLCELPSHAPVAAAVNSGEVVGSDSVASVLYRMEAVVEDLSVSSGVTSGGTVVVVYGDRLPDGDGLSCRVGSVGPLGARWMSRNTIECVTPGHTAGEVRLSIELLGHSHSTSSAGFEYVETGTILGVMPALVPVTGMVALELVGWALPRAASCRIGGVEAPGCMLPAGGMGFTDVVVEFAEPHPGVHAMVTYQARPQVNGLIPKTGYAAGGSIGHVYGAGFIEESAACVFGGVQVGAMFVSSGLLLCESPGGDAGMVTVEATHSGSEMTMAYITDMVVTRVSPRSGPLEGGNVITVHGDSFLGAVSCKIGTIGPHTARDQSSTSLECITPSHDASTVMVEVGIHTAGYTHDEVQYTYEAALIVEAVIPSAGQSSMLRSISVYGIGIRIGEGSTCVIGPQTTQGRVGRAGEMVCTVPGGSEGFVAVGSGGLRVVNGELDVLYEFRKPAEALALYPRSGYAGGGSLVQVVGKHMGSAGCSFGGMPGAAHVVSSVLMKCEAPASASMGDSSMQLLDGWQAGSAAELMYEYRVEETVSGLTPPNATSAGGVLVEVSATGLVNARGLACAVGTIAPVSARWVSERIAECSMPSHYAAAVAVRIGAGGEYGHSGREMRLTAAAPGPAEDVAALSKESIATVRSMTPRSGPSHGGSRVMVSGTELALTRALDFGGSLVNMEVVSSVLAVVESPAGAAGPAVVQEGATFEYTEVIDVTFLDPATVTAAGGGAFSIRGSFGAVQAAAACWVGTIGPVAGRWISSDAIECVAPLHVAGLVDVAVTVGYGAVHATGFSLQYVVPDNVTDAAALDDVHGNATVGEVRVVMPRHVSHHGQGITLVHFSPQPKPFWSVSRFKSSL